MNKHILRFANLAGVILLSIFAFTLSDIIIDKYNLKNYFLYLHVWRNGRVVECGGLENR